MTLTQRGWIRCCHVRGRKGTLRGALLDDPLHTDPRLAPIMFRLARELMEAGDEGRTLRVEALCDEVVRTATPDPISSAASQDLCARADEYLRANLDASPGLADIAIGIGVDRCHLARSFRRSRGCTIGEAARLLRLRRAFAELVESDLPLSAVAVRAGFADQSHFGRVFRARFGTTPGAVRRGR
ncbi:MAG TPA: hypothetical protein DEB06_11490 [Phycisphaerales bacterium]|nr:hypothetical protein [Phycisphaerales bacterium]